MDVISAYRDVGSYRGAAAICGTTRKTVKRIIELHEAGNAPVEKPSRARNFDEVSDVVAKAGPGGVGADLGQAAAARGAGGGLSRFGAELPPAGCRGQGAVAAGPSAGPAAGGLDARG